MNEPDIWPLTQSDCDWLDLRIDLAIHDTNNESREMLIHELRESLKDIPGYEDLTIEYEPNGHQILRIDGKVLEIGPMASNEEIRLALKNTLVRTENTKVITVMSPIDRIKAKALQARQVAPDAIKAFEADLDGIIAEGPALASKRQVAVSVHQEAIAGVMGEIDGLKSAIDILSNGGPPLPGSNTDSKGS